MLHFLELGDSTEYTSQFSYIFEANNSLANGAMKQTFSSNHTDNFCLCNVHESDLIILDHNISIQVKDLMVYLKLLIDL